MHAHFRKNKTATHAFDSMNGNDEDFAVYTLEEYQQANRNEEFVLKPSGGGAMWKMFDTNTRCYGCKILLENVQFTSRFNPARGDNKHRILFQVQNDLKAIFSSFGWFHNSLFHLINRDRQVINTLHPLVDSRSNFTTKAIYCNEHHCLQGVSVFQDTSSSSEAHGYHEHDDDANKSSIVDCFDWMFKSLDITLSILGVYVPAGQTIGYVISSLSSVLVKGPRPGDHPLSNPVPRWQQSRVSEEKTNNNVTNNNNNINNTSNNNTAANFLKQFTAEELAEQTRLLAEFESKREQNNKRKLDELNELKSKPALTTWDDETVIRKLVEQGMDETMVRGLTPQMFAPLKLMIEKQLSWQQRLEDETQRLVKQKEELENDLSRSKCKCCMEKDIDIVFEPCKHVVCCFECAGKLEKCLICRTAIRCRTKCFTA